MASNVFNYQKATFVYIELSENQLTFIRTGTFNSPSAAVLMEDNRRTNDDRINNPSGYSNKRNQSISIYDISKKEFAILKLMIYILF